MPRGHIEKSPRHPVTVNIVVAIGVVIGMVIVVALVVARVIEGGNAPIPPLRSPALLAPGGRLAFSLPTPLLAFATPLASDPATPPIVVVPVVPVVFITVGIIIIVVVAIVVVAIVVLGVGIPPPPPPVISAGGRGASDPPFPAAIRGWSLVPSVVPAVVPAFVSSVVSSTPSCGPPRFAEFFLQLLCRPRRPPQARLSSSPRVTAIPTATLTVSTPPAAPVIVASGAAVRVGSPCAGGRCGLEAMAVLRGWLRCE